MAKWIVSKTDNGNDIGRFTQDATQHLPKIEAIIEECGNDFIAWTVLEGDKFVEHGQEFGSDGWFSAMHKANEVINYGSESFRKKQEQLAHEASLRALAKKYSKESA